MSLDIRPNPSVTGSVTGSLVYKGPYNVTTNNPDLTSSQKGDFYIVNPNSGTLAGVTLNVGDHIVFNQNASSPITSAMFDVIDNTDAVASVNTQTGVVVLDTDDISEGSSNLYYTNTRADARIGAANLTDLNDVNYTAGAGIDGQFLKYVDSNNRWEAAAAPAGAVTSVNTQTGAVVLDTDDVSEGSSNLYYTNARFDTQLGTKTTDNLTEGSSNLYYTNARFDTQLGTKTTDNVTEGSSNLYYTNARFDTQLGTKDTDNLSEGSSNLYFTNARADARADARIGAANLTDLNDVNYTAGAGIDNYVLTYNHSNTRWEAEAPASAPVSSVNTQTGAVVLDTDDISEGSSNLYYTNARFDTQLGTKTTDNLTEGSSNLYYTNARFDTQLGTKDTGDLSEGSNLYYTNARADGRIGAANLTDLNDVNYTAGAGIDNYVLTYNHSNTRWEAEAPASAPVSSVNTQTGAVVLDTDDISEGSTNLYFTNTRADGRISAANLTDLNDVNYTAGAGIDNYVLTYNHANTRWEAEAPGGSTDTLDDVVGRGATTSTPITVGDLKINSNSAGTSTSGSIATLASNNNIKLDPHGSGVPELIGNATRGSGQVQFNCEQNSHGIILKGPPHSAAASYTMILPDALGSNGQVLSLQDSNTGELAFINSPVSSVNTQTGAVVLDTDDISEGSTNLYFTNTRADGRISAANLTDLNDVNYTAGSGIDNYVLTYNHANTRWEAEAPASGGVSINVAILADQDHSPLAYSSSDDEEFFIMTPTANRTVTLTDISSSSVPEGYKVNIKNLSSSFDIVVQAGTNDIIDATGVTHTLSTQYESVTLVCDGTSKWYRV